MLLRLCLEFLAALAIFAVMLGWVWLLSTAIAKQAAEQTPASHLGRVDMLLHRIAEISTGEAAQLADEAHALVHEACSQLGSGMPYRREA